MSTSDASPLRGAISSVAPELSDSELDETVTPIGKLTACDDNCYRSELEDSVRDFFCQAERFLYQRP